jgi:hypothetical protein
MAKTMAQTKKVGVMQFDKRLFGFILLIITSCSKSVEQNIGSARKIALTASKSIFQHYRMTGEITFTINNEEISQPIDTWLAEKDKMRITVGGDGLKNIFLLDGNECWSKVPNQVFTEYESGMKQLQIETELRWFVMRLPWDLPTDKFELELNSKNLPSLVSYKETTLKLSDYQKMGTNGILYPTKWQWLSPEMQRVEVYKNIQDGSLFLDHSFRPLKNKITDTIRLAHKENEVLANRLSITKETLFFLSEENVNTEKELPEGHWWIRGDNRYYMLTNPLKKQIKHLESSGEQTWLRWATYDNINEKVGIERITAICNQTGREIIGDIWAKEVKDSQRRLIRVFLAPISQEEFQEASPPVETNQR